MFRSGKRKRMTASLRSGLIFPVSRIHRIIQSLPNIPNRVSKGASIYLTAIIEYLTGMYIERTKAMIKKRAMVILNL